VPENPLIRTSEGRVPRIARIFVQQHAKRVGLVELRGTRPSQVCRSLRFVPRTAEC